MMKKLFLLALVFIFSFNIHAQMQGSITNITCYPANPTTSDTVYLYVDCVFPSSSCPVFTSSHSMIGNTIFASALHCPGMFTAICNTTDTFMILPLSPGTYIFDMTLSSGFGGPPCTPGFVPDDNQLFTFIVTTGATPCTVEINNGAVNIEMCDGDTVILEATTGFDIYLWTTSGPTIGTTNIITTTIPGIYTVVATDSVCVDIDSIEVILYQSPPLSIGSTPNPPMICLGDSVVLEASSGFVSYSWNNGMTGDRIVDFPGQDTWYMVEAVDSNGCVVLEDIWVYVDTCTSTNISNLSLKQIMIYPNPTSGKVNIILPKGEDFYFTLYDLQGRLVLKKENIAERFVFDTKEISKGTYLIKLESVKEKYSRKLLIE